MSLDARANDTVAKIVAEITGKRVTPEVLEIVRDEVMAYMGKVPTADLRREGPKHFVRRVVASGGFVGMLYSIGKRVSDHEQKMQAAQPMKSSLGYVDLAIAVVVVAFILHFFYDDFAKIWKEKVEELKEAMQGIRP
ncbi:hypothetical protein [Azospirillum argentinense]